ncbi:MAG: hypothetical protein ACYTFK_12220 [Planctomycetota bacterium]|jgi:hypothetical protein
MFRLVNLSFVVIMFLCASLFLCSCANPDAVSHGNKKNYPFAGDWQGSGVDSEGNEFTFAAKVVASGYDKYRLLVLDKIDTQKDPIHVMDGVLKDNVFAYTADGGMYVGEGELAEEMFEGYYKGPVDGTYKMHRLR